MHRKKQHNKQEDNNIIRTTHIDHNSHSHQLSESFGPNQLGKTKRDRHSHPASNNHSRRRSPHRSLPQDRSNYSENSQRQARHRRNYAKPDLVVMDKHCC